MLPLVKAMGFRVRAVIAALSRDVFWSHVEAETELLLRTATGVQQHPNPLPSVYLHKQVHVLGEPCVACGVWRTHRQTRICVLLDRTQCVAM